MFEGRGGLWKPGCLYKEIQPDKKTGQLLTNRKVTVLSGPHSHLIGTACPSIISRRCLGYAWIRVEGNCAITSDFLTSQLDGSLCK